MAGGGSSGLGGIQQNYGYGGGGYGGYGGGSQGYGGSSYNPWLNAQYYAQSGSQGQPTPAAPAPEAAATGWSPFGNTGPTYYRTPMGQYISTGVTPQGGQAPNVTNQMLSNIPYLPYGSYGQWDATQNRPGSVMFGQGTNAQQYNYDPNSKLYDLLNGQTTPDLTNLPFIPGVTINAPPSGWNLPGMGGGMQMGGGYPGYGGGWGW